MRDVLIALLPALIAAVIHYGVRPILVVAVCVVFACLSEYVMEKVCKKPNTVSDLSAVVTGVLLAYNLPVGIPLWMAAFGSIAAVAFVKQLFGGLGQNFANPAITGRIILLVSFASAMTDWKTGYPDAIAGATPLAALSSGAALPSKLDLFLGSIGGCIGETSKLALLIGFVYLLVRRVITWHTPVAFVATVFVLTALLGQDPVYEILSGGLMLGAIFMATDYATTPSNSKGRLIFGVGCGLLTVLIRLYGSYPEGVSFAILLMNILTPHIEQLTETKPLGGAAK
jgi:electron transport complex protein RnfD